MAEAIDPAVEAGLSQLQEIPLPPPVAYVPQTIGWAVIGVLLLVAIAFVVLRVVRHRRLNAYRREALAELEEIGKDLLSQTPSPPSPASEGGRKKEWRALPELLKRTAIAATSRQKVASLTGDEWLRFLDRSLGKGNEFEQGAGRLLLPLAYSKLPPSTSDEQLGSLIDLSRRWIRHHHADV